MTGSGCDTWTDDDQSDVRTSDVTGCAAYSIRPPAHVLYTIRVAATPYIYGVAATRIVYNTCAGGLIEYAAQPVTSDVLTSDWSSSVHVSHPLPVTQLECH